MKILVVANMYPTDEKPHFGTFVKACVDGYRSQGVEVDLAVLTHTGLRGYLAFYFTAFIKCIFNRYDYVHVHYVTHSIPPVYLANLLRKNKILLNFHGSDAFPESYETTLRRYVKRAVCKLALKNSFSTIVPSRYFKHKLSKSYDVGRIIISPSGGVDSKQFKYNPPIGRTVLFAGRMIKEKGPLIAARAILDNAELIDRVVFVGDGPELEKVKLILSNCPDLRVEFFGLLSRSELAEKMTESDIFLFPSTREGESLGLVLVEAIFCGCLPIAINNGAVNEILSEFDSHLVVKNQQEMTAALAEVLSLDDKVPLSKLLLKKVKIYYDFISCAKNLVSELRGN